MQPTSSQHECSEHKQQSSDEADGSKGCRQSLKARLRSLLLFLSIRCLAFVAANGVDGLRIPDGVRDVVELLSSL